MRLKRLEIQGFKSFARPVSLEFGPGITAIVGPNGSGKSNISDAIRWVLGNRAPVVSGASVWKISFSPVRMANDRSVWLKFSSPSITWRAFSHLITVKCPSLAASIARGERVFY